MDRNTVLSAREPSGRAIGRGPRDSGRERACRRLDCARPPAASACRRRPPIAISPTRKISLLPSPPRVSMSSLRRCRARPAAPIPSSGAGLAYIEFANQNRGLFRLMFGPVLAERSKYPALQAASAGVEAMLVRGVADLDSAAAQRQSCGHGGVGPRARPRASDRRWLLSGGASNGPGGGDPGQSQTAETGGPGADFIAPQTAWRR